MPADVTRVADAIRRGALVELDAYWTDAYDELRRLAHAQLRRRLQGATLDTAGLVHDAYLRLQQSAPPVAGRNHFIAVCATVMRCLVIDELRRRGSAKRGGDWQRTTLTVSSGAGDSQPAIEALDLERALEELGRGAPELVHLVEMKFYGGLTNDEIATALDVSPSTVKRNWLKARTLLHALLDRDAAR